MRDRHKAVAAGKGHSVPNIKERHTSVSNACKAVAVREKHPAYNKERGTSASNAGIRK